LSQVSNQNTTSKIAAPSIQQLYFSIDEDKKLDYSTIQPQQTRIQGGNFILALSPRNLNKNNEAQL
jgi:hypothetical protein